MAFIVADRVRETSASTGTGVFTLAGAIVGYRSFSSAIGNGNTTYYTISNPGVNEWEVGIGTVSAGTLTRTTVLASSTGSTVNFTAGSKDVFCTYPAEAAVFADNSVTLTNKTISGASNTLTNIPNSALPTVDFAHGGTGQTTRQAAMDALAGATTSGSYLRGNGTDVVMAAIQAADVPTLNQNTTGNAANVTGTVAIGNGGTGKTTAPAALNSLMGWTTTATAAATTTLTNTSTYQQEFTGATTQTVVLPVTSTLARGWAFEIINNSTGTLTVNSSGGNLVGSLTAGTAATIICTLITGTTAASWDFSINGFATQTGTGAVVRDTSPAFTTSITGGTTFTAFNTTTTTLSIGGAATTMTLGGTTAAATYNIANGATATATTKTVNLGGGGVSGSTTNINLGSAVSGATTAGTVYGNWVFTSTGALQISKGTTAQQPGAPATGMMRYNSTTNQFEGYSGASPAWKSIGGSTISNDTTTATNLYPVFASATTGTAENLYTGNAKLLYKPSTGELQSTAVVASNGIFKNSQTVSADMTVASGENGGSFGPVSVASGVTVTVASGSTWTVV